RSQGRPGHIQVIDLMLVQGLCIAISLPIIFFTAVVDELYFILFHVKHNRVIWPKYITNNANMKQLSAWFPLHFVITCIRLSRSNCPIFLHWRKALFL